MAESSLDDLLETAKEHHKAGRYAEAEPLYRRYLAMKPESAEAAHLLGFMTYEAGKPEGGLELIRRAIALQPDKAEYHCNLGVVLAHLLRQEEAIEALRKALSLKREFPEGWYNLAASLFMRGKIPEAMDAYRQAIALRPNYAEAHNNLGNVLLVEGRLEEAIVEYQQALSLSPSMVVAAFNLSNTLRKVGRLDDAITWMRHAVALMPEYRVACKNLAIFLRERGLWTESVAMHRRTVYLHRADPEFEVLLADALRGAGELDEAIGLYRKNLAQRPGTPGVYRSMGQALEARGEIKEAGDAYAHALKLSDDFVEARCDLGNLLLITGHVEKALACFNEAINIRPTDPVAYSNRLKALHYLPDQNPTATYHEHIDWNQKHAQPLNYEIRSHDNDRDPDRRLKIGYVSPDFREHPVGCFMESLLEGHDPGQVEIFAYADVSRADAVTGRLQKLVSTWRNTMGISDPSVAEMIRNDKIDILVDLAGHMVGNRLLVFASKPAPIQITYLGYPDTTGLSAMDYRLTDMHADPERSTDQFYSEKLILLPRSFACYKPPADAPEVSALPALSKKYITFGSLNEMGQINSRMVELWCRILQQVPGSRMLIKNLGLNDEKTGQETLERFKAGGIDPSRVELRPKSATSIERLNTYSEIDIALDTYPYNGFLTGCEAMWMGAPVVTLAGQTHASRTVFSLLTNLKLSELAAQTPEEYIQLAVDLASDTSALSEIRESTRGWMRESPVMQGRRLAWNIESRVRAAWKEWAAATAVPVGT